MDDLVVTVEQGKVRGKTSVDYEGGTYYSFLGIPYARSPVGEFRFKAPQPVESWTGVRDCTKEGNECPQLHMFFNYYVGKEEDCLNLSVHTREINPNVLSPVMVWIHGGGFVYGSNTSEMFGPDYLMSQNIVLVLINYRIGVLGFLSLDDTSLGVPGNNGLKDMVQGLKWVQKNIKQFGGDPNNVTIFGESAGSASVHYLLLSSMTKGLFHKAICQSGVSLNSWAIGKSNGLTIAKYLGYKETDEREILEKLKTENIKNIVNAQFKFPDHLSAKDIRPFVPVIEKVSTEEAFLTEHPLKILEAGTFNKVPTMIGYCSEEGIFYEAVRRTKFVPLPNNLLTEIPYDLDVNESSDNQKELNDKLKEFYFFNEDVKEENVNHLYTLKTDNCFLYGIAKAVLIQTSISNEPVFFYRMSLEGPLNLYKRVCTAKHLKSLFLCYFLMKNTPLKGFFNSFSNIIPNKTINGVCHADDLGYFFKMFFSPPKIEKDSKEDFYIKRFLKLWTNFAKYGNPTPEMDELFNQTTWKAVSLDTVNMLDIGEKLECIPFPDINRVKFWDTIYGR